MKSIWEFYQKNNELPSSRNRFNLDLEDRACLIVRCDGSTTPNLCTESFLQCGPSRKSPGGFFRIQTNRTWGGSMEHCQCCLGRSCPWSRSGVGTWHSCSSHLPLWGWSCPRCQWIWWGPFRQPSRCSASNRCGWSCIPLNAREQKTFEGPGTITFWNLCLRAYLSYW